MELSSIDSNYTYVPLPPGRFIRVLQLHPARNFADPLHVSLQSLGLDNASQRCHRYHALSYVWGSPVGDRPVFCDGKQILVTENCELAMRYLRKPKSSRTLWIDAICINQASTDERNHQVELMADVYSLAHETLLWFGPGGDKEKRLFRKLRVTHLATLVKPKVLRRTLQKMLCAPLLILNKPHPCSWTWRGHFS